MDEQPYNDVVAQVRTSRWIVARVAAMMFLQYWPQGVWGVTVATYIAANTGVDGARIFSAGFAGYSTAAGAIGGMVMPVLFGFLSDRYFCAQHLVSLAHVGCALAVWQMGRSETQLEFFLYLLIYYQCFSPAAALTNKIALRHLKDASTEYPFVRIFSSAGWISAGLFIGFLWPTLTGQTIENSHIPFLVGAAGSIAMAIYSLTLPNTPPEDCAGLLLGQISRDCRSLLGNRRLMLFLIVSVLACMPSMAYNNFANPFLNHQQYKNAAALMTLGQVSDIAFLAILPFLIKRIGVPSLFFSGVVAWSVRYILLAAGSYFEIATPVLAAIAIHGACYALVYVVGVMFVDQLVEGHHRGTAQGIYTLASTGIGHLLGAAMVGATQATFLTPDGVSPPPYHWTAFWIVPAVVSSIAAAALVAMRHGLGNSRV